MRAVVFRLAIPFAVLALLTGVLLGLSSKWGVFRYAWVTVKLALLVATAAVGAGDHRAGARPRELGRRRCLDLGARAARRRSR